MRLECEHIMEVGQRIAVHDQALWNQCTVMNPKKHNFLCDDLPGFLKFQEFIIYLILMQISSFYVSAF